MSLTHISLASHFWDIGEQCRPRSDAAERRNRCRTETEIGAETSLYSDMGRVIGSFTKLSNVDHC